MTATRRTIETYAAPRSLAGQLPAYIFMVRVAIPVLTTQRQTQWLSLDRIAEDLAYGSTGSRLVEPFSSYAASKRDLRSLAQELDAHLMTSFGACGDVVRNTDCCQ